MGPRSRDKGKWPLSRIGFVTKLIFHLPKTCARAAHKLGLPKTGRYCHHWCNEWWRNGNCTMVRFCDDCFLSYGRNPSSQVKTHWQMCHSTADTQHPILNRTTFGWPFIEVIWPTKTGHLSILYELYERCHVAESFLRFCWFILCTFIVVSFYVVLLRLVLFRRLLFFHCDYWTLRCFGAREFCRSALSRAAVSLRLFREVLFNYL